MKIEAFDENNKKIVEVTGTIHTFVMYCCDEPMKLKAPVKTSDPPSLTILNIHECVKCGKYKSEKIFVIKEK